MRIILSIKNLYISLHMIQVILTKIMKNIYLIKIISQVGDPNIPFYIHRNLYPNEKDFGVTPDRIHESIYQLQ